MWTCPKCQSQVDPSFEVCWSCGTSRDGVEDPDFVPADESGPIDDPIRDHEVDLDANSLQELPGPPLELVECYRADHITEAKFVADQMANEGIAAVVQGEMLGSNDRWPNSRYSPTVMVRAEDLDRARTFIADFEGRKQARESGEGIWTCPNCRSKVDPSFDVCWSCGTSRDGVQDPSFLPADTGPPPTDPLDLDMPAGDAPVPASRPSEAGELVECYWALDVMQAKFLADKLSELGIPAVSDTHDMHDALGSMSSGPRVWVRAGDLPRARAWLDAYDQQFKSEHGRVE